MDQCVAEKLEIARVDEPARRPGHVRLAIHGRKCGDVAESADRLGLVLRDVGLTAVLDDLYAVRVRNLDNLVDLGSIAGRMHDDGCGNVLGYALRELLRAHIVTVGLAVHEPRLQPVEHDGRKRAGIGDRRDQNLAAFGKIKRRNGNVERRGSGRDCICVAAAHHLDESVGIELLERALDSPDRPCARRSSRAPR